MMERIFPPGRCFEVAFIMARQYWSQGKPAVIVHGRPVYHGKDRQGGERSRYWHAWVETEDPEHGLLAVDMAGVKPGAIPRDTYYEAGQIKEFHVDRFDQERAEELAKRFGHHGPWRVK